MSDIQLTTRYVNNAALFEQFNLESFWQNFQYLHGDTSL